MHGQNLRGAFVLTKEASLGVGFVGVFRSRWVSA